MAKPKGGRFKRASYDSTHVRLPDVLKSRVEELKDVFFEGGIEAIEYREELIARDCKLARKYEKLIGDTDNLLTSKSSKCLLDRNQAIELVKKLLRSKKSKVDSFVNLLTSIYGVEITKEDLTE